MIDGSSGELSATPLSVLNNNRKELSMLFAIAAVFAVFWLAGLFFRMAGGFVHIFLVIAVIILLISLFSSHGSP